MSQTRPYIVTVATADRGGIISCISAQLDRLECEIIAISQTVIGGYFTLTLQLYLPAKIDADSISAALRTALGGEARVAALAMNTSSPQARSDELYILTASGTAKPGAITALSTLVAERGGSFTDFYACEADSLMQVVAEVELPATQQLGPLQLDLQHLGSSVGLDVRLQHQRLFTATNNVVF